MTSARDLAEEQAFALTRAELQARTIIGTMQRLARDPLPGAVPSSPPAERHGTAIVVGAGPSLSTQLDALRAAAEHATIICVNAALPGLRRAGIRADWLVVRESLDQSHHLVGGGFDRAALDLSCHPAIFDTAEAEGADVHVFAPGSTMTWQIADALDMRPLYGGTAALTAAVALAGELGAARIITVGVDLAVLDGVAYDPASAYGAVKADAGADGLLRFTETDAWKTGARKVGAVPEPEVQRTDLVPCWDGQLRPGMHVAQVEWLEMFAKRARRDRVELFDTTARGSRKEGWRHDVLALSGVAYRGDCGRDEHLCAGPFNVVDPAAAARFLERVSADAEWYSLAAERPASILAASPLVTTMMVESAAAGSTIRAVERGTIREKIAGVYRGLGAQARWAREALSIDHPGDA